MHINASSTTLYGPESTALHIAAAQGDVEIVRVLLAAGATVETHQNPSLLLAAERGHVKVIQLLLETGPSTSSLGFDYGVLLSATDSVEMVQLLLEPKWGIDINKKYQVARYREAAPLCHAVMRGNFDVVRALLDAGAFVDTIDQDMHTPLVMATSKGNLDVVRTLLEAGANLRYNGGEMLGTPLMMAETPEMVQLLLEPTWGLGVNELIKWPAWYHGNGPETTAMHSVARIGNGRVLRALQEAGAVVDALDSDMRTPLAIAVASGRIEAARVLLEAGGCAAHAGTKGKGREQPSPLEDVGSAEMVRLLLEPAWGLEVNKLISNSYAGWVWEATALHFNAAKGNDGVVRALLDCGAIVDSLDENLETPLIYAINSYHCVDVARALLEAGADAF